MNWKKALTLGGLPLFLVSAFFLFVPSASASTLVEQTIATDEYTIHNTTGRTRIINSTVDTGNFNIISLKAKQSTGSPQYFSMYVTGDSSFTCLTLPSDDTLHDLVFNVGSHTLTDDFEIYLGQHTSLANCESGTGATYSDYKLYGKAPAVTNWSTRVNDSTIIDFTPYIKVEDFYPLTINDPGNQIPIIGPTLWQGSCPTNGTNQLFLGYSAIWSLPNDETDFTVDCVDHEWSAVKQVLLGQMGYVIIDKAWLDDQTIGICPGDAIHGACVITTGIDENFQYNLKLLYPECIPQNSCLKLESSNDWIFRFQYTLPTGTDLSTKKIVAMRCTQSDFTDCSTFEDELISVLDPELKQFVDVGDVYSTSRYYYKFGIYTLTDTLDFELKIIVDSTAGDDMISLLPPGTEDLGFWGNLARSLFVPSADSVTNFTNTLPDRLRGVIPFGYFYEIKDRLTDLDADEQALVLNFPIRVENVNYDFKPIDSGNSTLANVYDSFRTVLTFGFWIALLVYFYERVKHFEI